MNISRSPLMREVCLMWSIWHKNILLCLKDEGELREFWVKCENIFFILREWKHKIICLKVQAVLYSLKFQFQFFLCS